jgi:hypothetical protein
MGGNCNNIDLVPRFARPGELNGHRAWQQVKKNGTHHDAVGIFFVVSSTAGALFPWETLHKWRRTR